MIQSNTHLLLFLTDQKLSVWLYGKGLTPKSVPVQKQEAITIKSGQQLTNAWEDVSKRLHDEGRVLDQIHWVGDLAGIDLITAANPHKDDSIKPAAWQILSMNWLMSRVGASAGNAAPDQKWIKEILLPWLITEKHADERQHMQSVLAEEHEKKSTQLLREREVLKRENERLQAQNAALQQVDAERLARFLPALYSRVFTVLGGADLALLCGSVEPLNLPNPYPEPTEETLKVLQRDYRNLPRMHQQEIAGFISRFPHAQKLQVRPEMRDFLRDLQEN